jgi:hypothetical protein
MNSGDRRHRSFQEGLITALAVGGFFIILGIVAVLTPNIAEKTNAFFSNLTNVSYPMGNNSTLSLPAPANPAAQIGLFTAVMYFFLGIGILQIIILAARLAAHSRIGRIAETVGNMIFWLGGAVVANVFLLAGTLTGWFSFWALLIVLVGASLVARGLVHFSRGWSKSPKQQA